MAKPVNTKYTLIRHSAFTIKGDATFEKAVEERSLDAKELAAVARAGGLIFNSYGEASAAEEAENYPPEVVGLVPAVRGTFKQAGTLDVYIPAPANTTGSR